MPTAEDTPGPITGRARLRFRSHAPYLLRALGLDALLERLEIHDLTQDSVEIQVASEADDR